MNSKKVFSSNVIYKSLVIKSSLSINLAWRLDTEFNVEIGVEFRTIFFLCLLNDAEKCILEHLQDLEKVGWFHYKVIHPSFQSSRKQKSKWRISANNCCYNYLFFFWICRLKKILNSCRKSCKFTYICTGYLKAKSGK